MRSLRKKVCGFCFSLSALITSIWSASAMADYMNVILADNPVGYWRLGESGGTTAYDSTSYGNDGAASSGVTLGGSTAAMESITDSAARFNGSSGSISLSSTSAFGFDVGSAFTLEGWFKTTVNTTQCIIGKDNHTTGSIAGYYLSLANFGGGIGPYFQLENGNKYTYVYAGGSLNDGNWHYVAATYNGGAATSGNLALYVDGTKVSTTGAQSATLATSMTNSVSLRMGKRYNASGGDSAFNGSLDELAIYDYVLSDATIANHYIGVPEPSTISMLAIGLMGMLAYAWRKRK